MAATLLKLPEPEFLAQYRKLLASVPAARAADWIGGESAPRTPQQIDAARAARAAEAEAARAELARARQQTAQKEAELEAARRQAESGGAKTTPAVRPTPPRPAGGSRTGGVSEREYLQRLHAILGQSRKLQTQQVDTVVRNFRTLSTQFVASMSLEDIEEFASRASASS